MRLLTFQDKYVKDLFDYKEELNMTPIYECKKVFFQHREETLYNIFIDKMKEQLKIPKDRVMIPIWCWVIPKNQELTPEYINELYIRYIPKCDNMIGIELNVPNELVCVSNFQVWEDLRFDVTFNRANITIDMVDKLFEKQKGAVLQASIPFLDKKFITNINVYNDPKEKEYSQTEEEIKELHAKGEFLEG